MTTYITVLTRQPEAIERYLYSGVTVVERFTYVDVAYGAQLLAVDSDVGALNPLAEQQAARLSSGLHGARVHATREQALAHLAEFGVAV